MFNMLDDFDMRGQSYSILFSILIYSVLFSSYVQNDRIRSTLLSTMCSNVCVYKSSQLNDHPSAQPFFWCESAFAYAANNLFVHLYVL